MHIVIPVVWTTYTATIQGRRYKLVCCENCKTEFVYLLEREGSGVGTSMYHLNDAGASGHADSAARDTIQDYLNNDFDAVPCPTCFRYQRFMFPKLLGNTGSLAGLVILFASLFGCLTTLFALKVTYGFIQHRSEREQTTMIASWCVLAGLVLVGFGLTVLKRAQIRRFDPNTGEPNERMAIARSRTILREEFEKRTQSGESQPITPNTLSE